jgi:ribose/xylose/arabinose/galactoside ABC-type transport system permease subunit
MASEKPRTPPHAPLTTHRFRLPSISGPLFGALAVLSVFIVLVYLRYGLAGPGRFLSVGNLQVLVHDNTIAAVVGLGMLLIIISGGIDLSVGSVVALVTVATMWVYRFVYAGPDAVPLAEHWGLHWPGTHSVAAASTAAVAAGVAVGGLCGLCNGLVITGLRLPPFVATLGMFSIARGLAYWLSDRHPLAFPQGATPGWVSALGETASPLYARYSSAGWFVLTLLGGAAGLVLTLLFLLVMVLVRHRIATYVLAGFVFASVALLSLSIFYPGFWSLVLLALGMAVLLHLTVLGRYCYAIGSNEATARLCGVPIAGNKIVIYTLAGLLTGWAGVLSFAHVSSGDPSGNVGLELTVIAAVVIGGASLNGGQGTVLGALLGVLILGILENGVTAFDVPVEVKFILIGAIIIANTALSQWQRGRAE